ncbi:flagellar protein FliS [Jatrophihabitans endophyticus]|uniref:Flagellar protein FliS n=1 Tax=Jatrophihabitans endophyticus TaxID=1206085 RepID=A0A1M5IEN6_9ACTN|nr:flagellar export chaperone FliS [Jatrophihabitans endophyticus]SHG26717.1 flagellar protein FliS [Jatrophihabitans endophyticus]
MDAIRQRFLTDRVLTASPAQRVVMLYDRLALDLARARTDAAGADEHLDHANRIVAELLGSLDLSAGGPADNLSSLYGYMLREILQVQVSGETGRLTAIESMVWTLRDAWAAIAGGAAGTAEVAPQAAAAAAQPAALAGMSWTA